MAIKIIRPLSGSVKFLVPAAGPVKLVRVYQGPPGPAGTGPRVWFASVNHPIAKTDYWPRVDFPFTVEAAKGLKCTSGSGTLTITVNGTLAATLAFDTTTGGPLDDRPLSINVPDNADVEITTSGTYNAFRGTLAGTVPSSGGGAFPGTTLPAGGAAGQALVKLSNTNYDWGWLDVGGSVHTGQTLWVDQTNGSDGTAVRGRLDKPYQTLTAAKTAALSGDLIVVGPGTYDEGNLLKNGVNWHFHSGATVEFSGSLNGIFDDSALGANGPVVCKITGRGRFKHAGGDFLGLFDYDATRIAVVRQFDAGSDITIEAASLETEPAIGFAGHVIFHKAGTLRVRCDRVYGVSPATAVRWDGGPLHVHASHIESTANYALYMGTQAAPPEPPDEMYVTADRIVGAMTSTTQMDPEARMWVDCKLHSGQVTWREGKLYVRAEKYETGGYMSVEGGGVWYTVQKATCQQLVVHSGGQCWVDVFQAEQLAVSATYVTLTTNGHVRCGRMILGGVNSVGVQFNGAGSFQGTIDAAAATNGNPVVLNASGGFLRACELISGGGRNSVTASVARSVTVRQRLNRNVAAHANVTLIDDLP